MEKIKQSNKKTIFWFLVIINIILSLTDIFITYIGSPNLSREGNLLVYTFGLGWSSLIISSIIFLVIIISLLYYGYFRFNRTVIHCEGLKQYISILFFERPDKFNWVFYKFPKNKIGLSYFFTCIGYTLAIVIPIGKLLAIFLWLGVIYDLNIVNLYHNNFYNILISPFGRNDFIIGGIIFALFLFYHWFKKEYKINRKMLEEENN